MVVNKDGVLGKVVGFWEQAGAEICVAVDAYECVNNDPRLRALQRSQRVFFNYRSTVDSLIWVEESPAIIRVSLPPSLLY